MMAELFQTTPHNTTIHLKNVFEEAELEEDATCNEFLQVQLEGEGTVNGKSKFYNLDAVISVGYRVNSKLSTINDNIKTHTEKRNEFLKDLGLPLILKE